MDNQFRVIAIDSKLNISGRFQQTPKYEVQVNKELATKMGFIDGDLIEIRGDRTTAAKILSSDKDSLEGQVIGLNHLIRNNARVSTEDLVTIHKAESRGAHRIVLAPIGKHLKKSELLKIVAKKSFLNKPFVEGDVTYLRSNIMRYLLGSVTWLRVVKTEPGGVVIVNDDTEFEILSEPAAVTDATIHETIKEIPDFDDNLLEKDLQLEDSEWTKIGTLIELGLFNSFADAISFFLKEGIKAKSELFERSVSVAEQIRSLKQHVGND